MNPPEELQAITLKVPVVAPVGLAQIIVLFLATPVHQTNQAPHVAADVDKFGK